MDEVRVFAPGSVSNLGPGFDCLGAAVTGKGDVVTARRSRTPGVQVASVSDPRIPLSAARNTAALAAAVVIREIRGAGIELEVEKGLPLSGGLGGSAASAVAGALAASALFELDLPKPALLEAALAAEAVVAGRHADNVAPCLWGGLVLVLGLDPPQMVPRRVHPDLRLVLVTPGYLVETSQAREVLPAQVARADAIAQAANLAALLAGLEQGDCDLIRRAMTDRVAEPHRLALYPGYLEARTAGWDAGASGIAVSGAGPTVMAVVAAGREDEVASAMQEAYRRRDIEAAVHVASVDEAGARVLAS